MGRAISTDLRLRMVRGISAGESCREVTQQFDAAPSTAVRAQARYAAIVLPPRVIERQRSSMPPRSLTTPQNSFRIHSELGFGRTLSKMTTPLIHWNSGFFLVAGARNHLSELGSDGPTSSRSFGGRRSC